MPPFNTSFGGTNSALTPSRMGFGGFASPSMRFGASGAAPSSAVGPNVPQLLEEAGQQIGFSRPRGFNRSRGRGPFARVQSRRPARSRQEGFRVPSFLSGLTGFSGQRAPINGRRPVRSRLGRQGRLSPRDLMGFSGQRTPISGRRLARSRLGGQRDISGQVQLGLGDRVDNQAVGLPQLFGDVGAGARLALSGGGNLSAPVLNNPFVRLRQLLLSGQL